MTNWEKVKLGRLLTESRIESGSPDTSRRIRVKLNVGGVEKRPETNDKEGATKYFIRKKGQFIYGRQNLHKGAFGIVPEELDGFESSSDIPAFDVDISCYPEWIYYFFKQGNFYLSLESLAKGVGSKRIHPEQLFQISIPLPPKETQKAIIEKILTFEKNYATAVEENASQLSLLTALRQAILTEAVQGKLTAQWRRDNPNQEPAGELLKRIAAEKARLLKEKKIGKEKPLPPIAAEEMPYEAPEGWVWCYMQDLCQIITDGTHQTPLYTTTGKIFLSAKNVKPFKFMPEAHQFVSEVDFEGYRKNRKPELNDILLTRVGSSIGEAALIDKDIEFAIYVSLALLKMVPQMIEPRYLVIWLNSPIGRGFSTENTLGRGMSQGNLNLALIRNFMVSLPPLSEQHAIVQKVNTLLACCDELEQQVRQSKADLDLLMQAVLGEVFGNAA